MSGHAQARDDTSRDLNPLYQQTHEAALLYGRGMRAGIDRREQKKAGAELERATVAKIRKTQARPARRARPVARAGARIGQGRCEPSGLRGWWRGRRARSALCRGVRLGAY